MAEKHLIVYIDNVVLTETPEYPPVADFVADVCTGGYPLAVTFTDLTSNTPLSWSWDFGDEGYSFLQNPTHTYSGVGSYTVVLAVANEYTGDIETKSSYINVLPMPYIITLLDSYEQYPVISGLVTHAALSEEFDSSGVAVVSGLLSGSNTLALSAPRYSNLEISKTVDASTTGETTIYLERSFCDGGVI